MHVYLNLIIFTHCFGIPENRDRGPYQKPENREPGTLVGAWVDCKCIEFIAVGCCTRKSSRFDQTIRNQKSYLWWFGNPACRECLLCFLAESMEHEGSISACSFCGKLADCYSKVFSLIHPVDEFSFKEMRTWGQSKISSCCKSSFKSRCLM